MEDWETFNGNDKPPNPDTVPVDVKMNNMPDGSIDITISFKEIKP